MPGGTRQYDVGNFTNYGEGGKVRRLATSDVVTGVVATDGTMAKYTRDTGDTVLRYGTSLVGEGQEYVTVKGGRATVTVSGTTVTASGEDATSHRVFAPQDISLVTINDAAVGACRDGDILTFPCATAGAPGDVVPAPSGDGSVAASPAGGPGADAVPTAASASTKTPLPATGGGTAVMTLVALTAAGSLIRRRRVS